MESVLALYREELVAVVVESTYNWYWLVDGLQELCYPVRLAHPAGNKPYSGLKHSDDVDDAFFLAELARVNCLSEGYIYPRETRGVRDLLRQRSRLVRRRTSHVLSIKNVFARERGPSLSRAQVEGLSEEAIKEAVRDVYAQVGVRGPCWKRLILRRSTTRWRSAFLSASGPRAMRFWPAKPWALS